MTDRIVRPTKLPHDRNKADNPAGPELDNLADDPTESQNVADENSDVVAKLRQEAEQREAELFKNKRPPDRAE